MEKELVFLDINKFLPYHYILFYAKTKNGVRKVMFGNFGFFIGYKYMDCKHPLENCYCSIYDILGWRYVDDNYMNELMFSTNHYMRQKEGEAILSKIKYPFFKKIIYIIKARIQRN